MIHPDIKNKLFQVDKHLQLAGMKPLAPPEIAALIAKMQGGQSAGQQMPQGQQMPPGAPQPQMMPPPQAGGPVGMPPQGGPPGMPGMPPQGQPGQPQQQFDTKVEIILNPLGQIRKYSKTMTAVNEGGTP